jgi:hypothetical protein
VRQPLHNLKTEGSLKEVVLDHSWVAPAGRWNAKWRRGKLSGIQSRADVIVGIANALQ